MKPRNLKMKLPFMYPRNDDQMHDSHADSTFFIVVQRSDMRVIKIFAQALVLALLIMVLMPSLSESLPSNEGSLDLKKIPLVLDDLATQGLLTTTPDKSLVVVNNGDMISTKNDVVIISANNHQQQSSVPEATFDFAFTHSFFFETVKEFIDRTLNTGGIVVVQFNQNPSINFESPTSNGDYRMVYFRRGFDNGDETLIAMRKVSKTSKSKIKSPSPTKRKLLEYYFTSEKRKNALKNLEDVLLEPPRSASGKSRAYLRKTKFLPDLLNDSLEGYPRRVYIDVGGGNGSTRWFEQNYPTRNKDFDMYRIETVPETETEDETDDAWEGPPTQMGISDWLWRNVKEEEYVVMKAEAEVVEEMIKSKAIVLVDELFLDCKPKPWGKQQGANAGKNRRAYWECLALYGRLRDFGVAVHQWWG